MICISFRTKCTLHLPSCVCKHNNTEHIRQLLSKPCPSQFNTHLYQQLSALRVWIAVRIEHPHHQRQHQTDGHEHAHKHDKAADVLVGRTVLHYAVRVLRHIGPANGLSRRRLGRRRGAVGRRRGQQRLLATAGRMRRHIVRLLAAVPVAGRAVGRAAGRRGDLQLVAAHRQPFLALAIGARRARVGGRAPGARERRVERLRARLAVLQAGAGRIRRDANDGRVFDDVAVEVDAIVLVDGLAAGICWRWWRSSVSANTHFEFDSATTLTHDLLVDDVRIGHADLHRMSVLLDFVHIDRHAKVMEDDVPGVQQRGTERELAGVVVVLQMDVFPQHGEGGAVVLEAHIRVRLQAGVEVGHQRCNVLGGGQPRVHVLAGVQEAAGGNGDIAHRVAVERKVERQLDGL